MMKHLNTTYSLLCVTLLMVFFVASCDQKPDPASSVGTDDYPTATVTSDLQGNTVSEGDTVRFDVTMDRSPENPIPFDFVVSGGSASADDYEVTSTKYPEYGQDTTVTVKVVFKQDNIPEKDEDLSWKIDVNNVGLREAINPNSSLPSGDLTIKNKNNPNGLTVAFGWNTGADMDMFYVLYQEGAAVALNQDGATGSNPEIIVDDSGAPGTFYYSVNPFDYSEPDTDYKLSIGYPDQSVDFISGSFNADSVAAGTGVFPIEPALGADFGRMLKVTSTTNASGANSFTVEDLNSGGSDGSGS